MSLIIALSTALIIARWFAPTLFADAPTVVLDAGHGGDESGAEASGIVERDSNLDFADRVQRLLEQDGVRVVLTRSGHDRPAAIRGATIPDAATLSGYSATFADLQNRVNIANRAQADVFISIHSNN